MDAYVIDLAPLCKDCRGEFHVACEFHGCSCAFDFLRDGTYYFNLDFVFVFNVATN